jgi:hypothetical protein
MSEMLKKGEVFAPPQPRHFRPGSSPDKFCVGLSHDRGRAYATIKLPKALTLDRARVRVITKKNDDAIAAFVMAEAAEDTPASEVYAVKKNRIVFRVSTRSTIDNAYPKEATSSTDDGMTRVDVPSGLDLRIDIEDQDNGN